MSTGESATIGQGGEPEFELPLAGEIMLDALAELEYLPEDELFVAYGEGVLRGKRLRLIRQLEASNLGVLMLANSFRRDCLPVRNLSRGWLGWKGPILAAQNRLPETVTAEAWRAHTGRCFGARIRTWIARAFLEAGSSASPQESRAPVTLRLVTIGALAVSLVVAINRPALLTGEVREDGRQGKGGGSASSVAATDAEILDWVEPQATEQSLRASLDRTQRLLGARPKGRGLLLQQEQLLERYLALPVDLSTNEARRTEYRRLLQETRRRLNEPDR